MTAEIALKGRARQAAQPWVAAWALFGLAFALLFSVWMFILLTPASSAPPSYRPNGVDFLFPPMVLAFSLVGALIVTSRPRNRIGWICCAIGALFSLEAFVIKYAAFALFVEPGAPAGIWAMWAGQWTFAIPSILVAAFLPLLFPDGRLPSRGWLPVALLAVGTCLLIIVQRSLYPEMDLQGYRAPNPTGAPGVKAALDSLNGFIGGLMIASFVASVAAIGFRFARADSEQRQQLKWFTSAISILVFALAASFVTGAFLHFGSGVDILIAIGFLLVPLSIGVAILRNHLFDIDLVISRTLLYGALAVFITGIYLVVVLGVGALLGTGTRGNLVLSLIATAIVAVAFQPVRERLQRLASRLVYGRRATPYELLSEFSQRVAGSYAADDVLARMVRILAEGTAANRAAVWLRVGDRFRLASAWPEQADLESVLPADREVPPIEGVSRVVEVRHQDEQLGLLTVTKRQGERLTPIEEKLLDDLGAQAGLVLRNVRLNTELLDRMQELQASRQRLVRAQDLERRRLERNLHDGAQQHLVAMKVKLGLAEALADRDPVKARELMGELKQEADEAIETLRDLARGIYPPVLVDKGLVAALEVQARRSPVSVDVRAGEVGRYQQELEAAVYFCCLEGLQNAGKYAGASSVVIEVGERNGRLHFSVHDDGRGFEVQEAAGGSGLQNMRDRLDALGGQLRVESTPGNGTTVSGSAPTTAAPVLA